MTTTNAAAHLALVVTHWGDLADSLGTPTVTTWPPSGIRNYLRTLDAHDADEVRTARQLDRSPDQIGATRPPLRIDILDTMRSVQAALVATADVIAAAVQRSPMPRAPRTWPATDRARRDQLADADAADPRRWRYQGTPRTAQEAAVWLLARVQGEGGPFRYLTDAEHRHVAVVARGAAERVERALDIGAQQRELERPCPCGGRITIHGGAAAAPVAHCRGCGAIWTEQGVAA